MARVGGAGGGRVLGNRRSGIAGDSGRLAPVWTGACSEIVVNSYALIAFATPAAALLLGWVAVALHRRSLRDRVLPKERARRLAQEEAELAASLDALIARADRLRKRTAKTRAELGQFEQDKARHQSRAGGGTALAR